MPVMDGKESARTIRELQNRSLANTEKETNIIMVSGNCSKSEVNACTDKNGNIRA